jgi:membrane protein required for colicin V production
MLTAFDVGVGILVLISAILATARGLTREVLSLATWAGSAALAIYMWQYHPEIARGFIKDPTVADIATVVVTFIVALIVLHLITMRIADFVVDSRIGPLDRTLGFIFGLVRGILIAVVLVIFGQWLLGANLPPWAAESKSLPMLQNIGNQLIAALPDDLEKQVTDILEGRTNPANDDEGPQDTAPSPDDPNSTDAGEDATPPPAAGGV